MFELPSTSKQDYWIVEKNRELNFFSNEKSGKWCIWFPSEEIDEVWKKVRQHVMDGFFVCAKVSTAKSRINNNHVIIVYNRDYNNLVEVNQNLLTLKRLGFKNLKYKRDIDTMNDVDQFIYEHE